MNNQHYSSRSPSSARAQPMARAAPDLGLSIVKELVLLHKGKVGVESVENNGCTFWVELPLHVPELHAVAV